MIGIDLVDIPRIRKALKNRRFKERLFSSREQDYCETKADPAQHYAARFAAKEAFIKAIGGQVGLFGGISRVEVVNRPSGQPQLQLPKRWKNWRSAISLSHTSKQAVAVCLLKKKRFSRKVV